MNTVMLIYFGVLLAAVATYYLFPKKVRWIVLLFFSCLFSVLISTYMFVFFLATAVSVYCVTNFFFRPLAEGTDERAIAKRNRRNRMAIALTVAFNLAILGVLKYYNFFGGMFNSIISLSGSGFRLPALQLALPLGISFYTLTAVGYMVDVNRGKYPPEKNFGKLTLFLCFFPKARFAVMIRRRRSLRKGMRRIIRACYSVYSVSSGDCSKKWWWRTDCICWFIPSPNPPRSIPESPLCCS